MWDYKFLEVELLRQRLHFYIYLKILELFLNDILTNRELECVALQPSLI